MDDLDLSGNIGIIEHHPERSPNTRSVSATLHGEEWVVDFRNTVHACDECLPSHDHLAAVVADRPSRLPAVSPAPVKRRAHPQDCVWAVTIDDRVVGLVSILHEGQHIARINTFRIHPNWQHTAALTKLIDRVHQYCWNHGYLKVTMEAEAAPGMVRKILEQRGFHLVRNRNVVGKPSLDYYIDLYYSPQQEEPPL